ncbi:MAG TPA: PCRF domain-containing protein, partial [Actinomycetota bacterium]|nr:PCRF domain-containing protein [Actinomycetota bacterium]
MLTTPRSSWPWVRRSPKPGPIFDVDAKRASIAELQQEAAAPDLWNDQASAKTLLARLARLEDDVKAYDVLARKHEDLAVLNELATAEDDPGVEQEVKEGI